MAGSLRQRVLVSLVSWNSEQDLQACLESVLAQTVPVRVKIFDNASSDRTLEIAGRFPVEVERSQVNLGFSRAHNLQLAGLDFDYALILNPDVVLGPHYLERLLVWMNREPRVGMAGGKLYRLDQAGKPLIKGGRPVLDSTGIYVTPALRHFDRGQGEVDRGQYDRPQFVFGITGAALLCRCEMLEDTRVDEEFFDEDFFAYREDADLAWRTQLRAWHALYVPEATAWHRRRVTPRNRGDLPELINYHSVKNRFLLRRKNADWAVRLRCFPFANCRDLAAFLYALVWERSSLPAFREAARLRERMNEKKRFIQSVRRISPMQMARWFSFRPRAEDLGPRQGDGRPAGRRLSRAE